MDAGINVYSNLKVLKLNGNAISSPFPYLGNLIKLDEIDLGRNHFTGEITDLSKLNITDASKCNLQDLGSVCRGPKTAIPAVCDISLLPDCPSNDCEVLNMWHTMISESQCCGYSNNSIQCDENNRVTVMFDRYLI